MQRARLRRYFRHGLLPQLMAFEACVRHGSVTRAAEELALAQPTISCLVRKLADAIGAPVLVLRQGRMEPTDAGKEVMLLCTDLVGAFDRYESRRAVAGTLSSRLPGTEAQDDGTAEQEDAEPRGRPRGDAGMRGEGHR